MQLGLLDALVEPRFLDGDVEFRHALAVLQSVDDELDVLAAAFAVAPFEFLDLPAQAFADFDDADDQCLGFGVKCVQRPSNLAGDFLAGVVEPVAEPRHFGLDGGHVLFPHHQPLVLLQRGVEQGGHGVPVPVDDQRGGGDGKVELRQPAGLRLRGWEGFQYFCGLCHDCILLVLLERNIVHAGGLGREGGAEVFIVG